MLLIAINYRGDFMEKKQLTLEQKKLDLDLIIIGVVTFLVYGVYGVYASQINNFVKNININVFLRLLLNSTIQFGVAGLGIVIVMFLRKESFIEFGLKKKNILKSILGTILCFVPSIIYTFISGNFNGYRPMSILIANDVLSSSFPINIFGMGLIFLVWGFFEGFNYVVISDKINKRYPYKNIWLNYGAIVCGIVCLFFHPIDVSLWGIIDLITMFFSIYGMLIVKSQTKNAWGIIFAFSFIWNAI